MNKSVPIKSAQLITLGVLPILLFIFIFLFKEAGGPYYLNYYDPGYVYLVNSINLIELEDIGHTDHPGTTVQIFGAIILKILFIGNTDAQILDTIFSDPESYLNILNKCLLIVNCIALFCLGIFVYRKTSNLLFSLLLQLSPFISLEIYYGLVIVSPENFLILSVLCLSAVLVYFVYNNESGKHMLSLAIIFAVICGFGAVSKLNFVPMCLLPLLIIKGLRFKLIFIAGTIIVFLILFSPALSKFSSFIVWIRNLTFESGIHGKTDLTSFDLSLYFQNIFTIFSKDIFFTIIYLMMAVILVLSSIVKGERRTEQEEIVYRKERRVLIAIFLTITFQILVVAKNYLPYAQYYIEPSLVLSVTGLAFLVSYTIRSFRSFTNLRPAKVYITVISIVILFSGFEILTSFSEASQFRDEAYKINKLIKVYSASETVIPSVGAANEDCALAVCTMYGYSGSRNPIYRAVFSKKSYSDIFHNYWENKLFSLSGSTDIKKVISDNKKIIFQLTHMTTIEMIIKMLKADYNTDIKDWKLIYKNGNGESIYEINL